MGWPKGKPRKPKESSAAQIGGANTTPNGIVPVLQGTARVPSAAAAGLDKRSGKRDPARKANTEIRKVLRQLELARAKVKELEATVADMTFALTGAVAPKQQWPAGISNLLQPEPEEPPGQAAPLAHGDSMGDGRWV